MGYGIAVRAFGAALGATLVVGMTASLALAQSPPVRIRGTIESFDGQAIVAKSREGQQVTIKVPENVRVTGIVKASMADIKEGTFVGVASMPDGDNFKALEVLVFPEAMRGTGEGHYPWDLQPKSMMTNATVSQSVKKVDGQTLTVKYKDGEKTLIVPADAPIVTFAAGDKAELKPGAKIIVFGATKQADGTFQAAGVGVGRDGMTPPM